MIGFLFSTTVILLVGMAASELIFQRLLHRNSTLPIALFLSMTLGLGLWGLSLIPLAWFVQPTPGALWVKDILLAAISIVILRHHRKKLQPLPEIPASGNPHAPAVLKILLILSAILSTGILLAAWMRSPDGIGDSWMVWNLRARFLASRGLDPQTTFSPLLSWAHMDYPILLPSIIAQAWVHLREFNTAIPIYYSCIVGILTVGMLLFTVRNFQGGKAGVVAGLVLLGTPFFHFCLTFQYADPLLACMILAAHAALAFGWQSHSLHPRGCHLFSGILISLAAWTKNEGCYHAVVLFLTLAWVHPFQTRGMTRQQSLGWFLAGAAPLLFLLLLFKLGPGASGHAVLTWDPWGIKVLLTDPERYQIFLASIFNRFFWFARWNYFIPILLALILLSIPLSSSNRLQKFLLKNLLVTGLGFMVVLLLTRYDLEWQIYTVMDRLIFQCWPSFILAVFLRLPTSFFQKSPPSIPS